MGAHSTINITRKTAQRFLIDRIMFHVTEEELAAMMDAALDDRLYNVRIVGDADANDDDQL